MGSRRVLLWKMIVAASALKGRKRCAQAADARVREIGEQASQAYSTEWKPHWWREADDEGECSDVSGCGNGRGEADGAARAAGSDKRRRCSDLCVTTIAFIVRLP